MGSLFVYRRAYLTQTPRSKRRVNFDIRKGDMFDEQFVAALATQIAARINPQLQRRNGHTLSRLLTVKDAAE